MLLGALLGLADASTTRCAPLRMMARAEGTGRVVSMRGIVPRGKGSRVATAEAEGETATIARKVIEDKPLLLIGSPPCADWSSLMDLNWGKMDPETVAERKRVARIHLEFCAKLY